MLDASALPRTEERASDQADCSASTSLARLGADPTGPTLRVVLGDQLTRSLSALDGLDPARDVVLLAEVLEEATYVRHHQQKIALFFSAMRHFAAELRQEGVRVDYVELEDPANTGTLTGEVARAARRHGSSRIVATEPGEHRVETAMRGWEAAAGVPVEVRPDTRFLLSREAFRAWAGPARRFRMEAFYRMMRQRTGLLMEEGRPAGGRWNYDLDNRSPLPAHVRVPDRPRPEPDAITRDVLGLVARRFGTHFGDLEPFRWAVTRQGALDALADFIERCLPAFGRYQDAMRHGEAMLWHSALSPYLNLGLLTPLEVCRAAEDAWRAGEAPLSAVEGFIRQIVGWREYVRALYWHLMPAYRRFNALRASRPLPWFFWTGETEMRCMASAIGSTKRHAYAHHIERLMVIGAFALMAGLDPAEVEEWYLIVYADAVEWVELPNTHGMALHADGGMLGSKPYAVSGAYINRMSDHCRGCAYDPHRREGPRACPFTLLYWRFLMEHEERLAGNERLAHNYETLARLPAERRARLHAGAEAFLARLDALPGGLDEPALASHPAPVPAQLAFDLLP